MTSYSREQVEALLEQDIAWDDDWAVMRAKPQDGGGVGSGDPRRSFDVVCVKADFDSAYRRLDWEQQDLLTARYMHCLSLDAIAELAGLEDVQEAADLTEAALNTFINNLNGGRIG